MMAVITSAAGGNGELFERDVEGLQWDVDDAEEAARLLVELLDDDRRVELMGLAARRRFVRDYDARVDRLPIPMIGSHREQIAVGAHSHRLTIGPVRRFTFFDSQIDAMQRPVYRIVA